MGLRPDHIRSASDGELHMYSKWGFEGFCLCQELNPNKMEKIRNRWRGSGCATLSSLTDFGANPADIDSDTNRTNRSG